MNELELAIAEINDFAVCNKIKTAITELPESIDRQDIAHCLLWIGCVLATASGLDKKEIIEITNNYMDESRKQPLNMQ